MVLCQPLGIEAICVYFSYRLLAQRLAQRGLAVLRFDYDGTGDSTGMEDDPDRLDAWLDSVSAATDALTTLGVGHVALVGVRIGGLFAAHEATRRGGVDALVLWDPCLSGRSFLREQRFLRLLSGNGADLGDEAVDAPGLRFEPETVKALSDLDLRRLPGPLAHRTLVLIPPDVSRPTSLEDRLEGADVDWQEATGQDLLLDSRLQEPPLATIGRLTDWLCGALDGPPTPVTPPDRALRHREPDAHGRAVGRAHGQARPPRPLRDRDGDPGDLGRSRPSSWSTKATRTTSGRPGSGWTWPAGWERPDSGCSASTSAASATATPDRGSGPMWVGPPRPSRTSTTPCGESAPTTRPTWCWSASAPVPMRSSSRRWPTPRGGSA